MNEGRALAGLIRSAVNSHTVNAAVSTDETLELANVWRRRVGAELTSDVDATTTTIPVDDPVPFADGPTQATVTDGETSETFTIVSVDEDACTLTVVRDAGAAWSAGAEVYVLPESEQTFVDAWYCDDTGEDSGVLEAIPISASVAARLVLGTRERGYGERVIARKLNASGAAHDWLVEAFADTAQRPLINPEIRDEWDETSPVDDAIASVGVAQGAADAAAAAAAAAQTAADAAMGTGSAAGTAAAAANTAATAAAATAATANTAATAANAAATAASTAATAAQTTANTANTAAGTANTAATAAQASATTANGLIADIAADDKLAASEKTALRTDWNTLVAEHVVLDQQADVYGADTGIDTAQTALDTKYVALGTYLNNNGAWAIGGAVPSFISDANLATTTALGAGGGATLRTKFGDYYSARQSLLKAITDKAKVLADAAQSTATTANTAAGTAQTTANTANTAASTAATAAAAAQTAANTANASIVDIFADDTLTPDEKQVLYAQWSIIVNEHPTLDAQADAYGAISAIDAAQVTLDSGYVGLGRCLNAGVTWAIGGPTPSLINPTNTTTVLAQWGGQDLAGYFAGYSAKRVALLKAIADQAKVLSDASTAAAAASLAAAAAAQTTANGAGTRADQAIADAASKARTFFVQPTTPYGLGDLYFASGGIVKKCWTARATGAYVAGDWLVWGLQADYVAANVAMSAPVITGGEITGGLLRTAASGLRVELDGGEFADRVRFFDTAGVEAAILQYVDVTPKGLYLSGLHTDFHVEGSISAVQSWIDVTTFYNAWVAYGAPGDIPGYSLFAGRVWLRGWMKLGADSARAFNLPIGYRPLKEKTLTTTNMSTVNTTAKVSTAGDVIPGGAYNSRVSLDGLSFSLT